MIPLKKGSHKEPLKRFLWLVKANIRSYKKSSSNKSDRDRGVYTVKKQWHFISLDFLHSFGSTSVFLSIFLKSLAPITNVVAIWHFLFSTFTLLLSFRYTS